MPVFEKIPATCYQDGQPDVALVSSCRRHVTPPDEQA
jgi:hypothetical protein